MKKQQTLHKNVQTFKTFLLPDKFVSFRSIYYVEHCKFLTKKRYYLLHSFTLTALNLVCGTSQKLYSNNMKKPQKLEFFGQFDIFCVKLKHISITKLHLYFKELTGQRIQLLLNIARVLIQENIEKLKKLRWGIKICY